MDQHAIANLISFLIVVLFSLVLCGTGVFLVLAAWRLFYG